MDSCLGYHLMMMVLSFLVLVGVTGKKTTTAENLCQNLKTDSSTSIFAIGFTPAHDLLLLTNTDFGFTVPNFLTYKQTSISSTSDIFRIADSWPKLPEIIQKLGSESRGFFSVQSNDEWWLYAVQGETAMKVNLKSSLEAERKLVNRENHKLVLSGVKNSFPVLTKGKLVYGSLESSGESLILKDISEGKTLDSDVTFDLGFTDDKLIYLISNQQKVMYVYEDPKGTSDSSVRLIEKVPFDQMFDCTGPKGKKISDSSRHILILVSILLLFAIIFFSTALYTFCRSRRFCKTSKRKAKKNKNVKNLKAKKEEVEKTMCFFEYATSSEVGPVIRSKYKTLTTPPDGMDLDF